MSHLPFIPSTALPSDELGDAVLQDLQFLRETVMFSAEMAERGALDDFAQQVDQMRRNPVAGWLNVIQTAEGQLRQEVQAVLLAFLRRKREIIQSVFQVKRAGLALEYVLVLAKNDLESKFAIDEFLQAYEQTVMASRVPVVLHFVGTDLLTELQHVESVDIDG